MKNWLWSVTAVSLLCSLAAALCPKGRVRAVTGFVCALVCMLTLLAPLKTLDAGELSSSMAYWRAEAQSVTASAERQAQEEQRLFIERRCEAYILDEAGSLGVEAADAEVRAQWDEEKMVWYPVSAVIGSPYDAALSRRIEASLGIAKEAQTWRD